jgi:DNA-binding NarL/FixJ family response regulator
MTVPTPETVQLRVNSFLTRREKEVLELIAEGLTNHQITDKIFVSVDGK